MYPVEEPECRRVKPGSLQKGLLDAALKRRSTIIAADPLLRDRFKRFGAAGTKPGVRVRRVDVPPPPAALCFQSFVRGFRKFCGNKGLSATS